MAKNSKARQQRMDPRKTAHAARSKKKGSPAPVVPKATLGDWIAGARLRTLPLSIGPVVLGTAVAYADSGFEHVRWLLALACLAVAVLLQIGVNFANDYSDGVRGSDLHRAGPTRLTGSGAAKPRTVLTVALVFFALSAVAGVAIVVRTELWWMLAVGAAALLAGWFYTGGKKPYGYFGLGEVFVFVFFGLVATVGTTYVQTQTLPLMAWLAGITMGLFACAVLLTNNLRDLEQDRAAGKRTLTVLIGSLPSRILFTVFVLAPFVILVFFTLLFPNANYVFFVLFLAIPVTLIVMTAKTSKEFVLALGLTSLSALLFALGLAAAIAL
ncbi:MAG TPA: 1,4-dihydroxy-2-naphthoate polyprenyltransferase [Terrimesophilobacter sp.]|nr:1,4-dihydroxy-2-naphthoate polyprenyltransferase [Terrimesophilobacter sp.]